MPDISITDEQLDRLEEIQQDVADAFIEGYGHARPTDALQYLLDTYLPPTVDGEASAYVRIVRANLEELTQVASAVDVAAETNEPDELRGRLLATLGAEELASRLDDIETPDDEPVSTSEKQTPPTDADTTDESTESEDEEDGSNAPSPTEVTAPAGAAEGSLGGLNELLDKHDNKWRDNDGEAPYEVELPDGSTTTARTKDDIRKILFQHY